MPSLDMEQENPGAPIPRCLDPIAWLLHGVFLFSGAAALVYQLVWQRVLYTIYGIDIASVTVVVTAFMLGLGIGSLFGGALSRIAPRFTLEIFAAFEIAIGLFGLFSIGIIETVCGMTLGISHLMTGLVTFLLVVVPTTFMGGTLPLLVHFATNRSRNVGKSVGSLYFANTMGAALGTWATVAILFESLGLTGSARAAAVLNIALGFIIAGFSRRQQKGAGA